MADFGGRYRQVRLLRAGGMGEVWLALDEELGERPVAIKRMHSRALADAADVARFQREMRLAARMQHPNIASVPVSAGLAKLQQELAQVQAEIPGARPGS